MTTGLDKEEALTPSLMSMGDALKTEREGEREREGGRVRGREGGRERETIDNLNCKSKRTKNNHL